MKNATVNPRSKSLIPGVTFFISSLVLLSFISLFCSCPADNTNNSQSKEEVQLTRPIVTKVTVQVKGTSPRTQICSSTTITIKVPRATSANFGIYSKGLSAFDPGNTDAGTHDFTIPADSSMITPPTYTDTTVVYDLTTVAFFGNPPTSSDTMVTITYNSPQESDSNKGFAYGEDCR